MLKKLTLSLLISAPLSAAANANWYVGGGIGHSNFDYDQDTASATTSDSASSVSGKLFGGYQCRVC
ncbi:hypothetical protein [Paraferrimonas sp. SM1919]|uniref:hypothetical protein n=1 Tax=Paraferrimonas sp. SM1919 TaxID=2662263 RepID=UPI0013D59585|nr:hypothetical protein [Paraferrimonas sp. SM1919]